MKRAKGKAFSEAELEEIAFLAHGNSASVIAELMHTKPAAIVRAMKTWREKQGRIPAPWAPLVGVERKR
jgi:hypothetical protein